MIRPGNHHGQGVSFEAVNFPGHFLRHQGFRVKLANREHNELYNLDTTFVLTRAPTNDPKLLLIYSVKYPAKAQRHKNFEMWLDDYCGSKQLRTGPGRWDDEIKSKNSIDNYLKTQH